MILIEGFPDSGKSRLGEDITLQLAAGEKIAYIATMIPFGKEGEERIQKHRLLRKGKGFETFEKPTCLTSLIKAFKNDKIQTALLECVSNLVGNEIYSEENCGKSTKELEERIVHEIITLDKFLTNFIVITNHFETSYEYNEETKKYIELTSLVNERLKENAKEYYVKTGEEWLHYENN